jgi:hypothetical protein
MNTDEIAVELRKLRESVDAVAGKHPSKEMLIRALQLLRSLKTWSEAQTGIHLEEFEPGTPPFDVWEFLQRTSGVITGSEDTGDEALVKAALSWADGPGKTDAAVSQALGLRRKWLCHGRLSENDGDVTARILAAEVRRLQKLVSCPFRDNRSSATFLSMVGAKVDEESVAKWTDPQLLLAEEWAIATFLRRSDSGVQVPEKPAFVP